MANKDRGEVDLVAGGKTYTLRFGMNAVAEAEALLDMGVNQIARMMNDPDNLRIGNWRALLWAALREHHKGVDLLAAGELIGVAGLGAVIEKLGEALALGFPEPGNKAEAENPQSASA